MGIAAINNKVPLMKSLLGLPQLMTTRVTVGDRGGKTAGDSYQVTITFELDSGKLPTMQNKDTFSSWKDSPKLTSVLNLNFKKHMRVHVINMYGSFAGPASAQYLNFLNNQDIKAFYRAFAGHKENSEIYPAGPDKNQLPAYLSDMSMPVNFSHGMPNYSRGSSNIIMEAKFDLSHYEEEPLSLSSFLIPYIDLQGLLNDFPDIDIELLANGYIGDIRALTAGVPVYQKILENGEVPKLSNTYVTADNDYWTGKVKKKVIGDDKPTTYVGIPGDVPLTLRKVPNTLVQDLRAKQDLKKPNLLELKKMLSSPQSLLSYKDVGSENILIDPKTSNFSELFLSKDVNGSARGYFIFNKEKYLFSEGAFAGLMSPKGGNISVNTSFVSMTKLQEIKIYRRKVKKGFSSTNEDKYVPAPSTEQQEVKLVFHGAFDETESLSVIEAHKFMLRQNDVDYDNLSLEGPKIPKLILNQFTFYDEDVRLYSDSAFEYEVELEIMDGSYSYIKNMHDKLQKNVSDMEALYAFALRPAQPGSTPYYVAHSNMFSQTWKNGPGADFKPMVVESIISYLSAMGALLAPESYKKGNANPFGSDLKASLMKLKDKLVSHLSYESGTIDTYELFIKMQKELLATIKNFMKLKSGAKSSFDEDKGGVGNTGAKPMINTTSHTFKEVFSTKYHLEGTVLAYDPLLNADSTVMKSILTKPGKAYQKGLLTLTETQLRARANQESLRYYDETDGPITMDKDKQKVQGGSIRDNSLTYLTPSTVLMHGDLVDLSSISIVKQGTNKLSLSQKKYPKIIADLLLKKNKIDKSVKKIEQAPKFNLGDAGPINAGNPPAPGANVVFDSPFGAGVAPAIQEKMKKGIADLKELKSDLSILLDSAGVSIYTKEKVIPAKKKKKEKQIKNPGMGGIGAGPGNGNMAPFKADDEPPEGAYFVAEVSVQDNVPLSISYALLSNLTFGTVSSGKSIEDYEEPPKSADGTNILPTLPNQIKSLYAGQSNEGSVVKVDWNSLQKDIVNAYDNTGLFYFNYELIYKIDILAGFQSHNMYKPLFVPLSDANIEGYRGKTVLCRMSRYEKLTNHVLHSKMHLPLVNEYFFLEIDPPAVPAPPPASPAEEIEEYVVNIVEMPIIPIPIVQQSDEARAMEDNSVPFTPGLIPAPLPFIPGQPGKPGGGYNI